MKKTILLLFLIASSSFAQIPVKFLPSSPLIDGLPDENLNHLQTEYFYEIYSGNENIPSEPLAEYSLAYGIDFLYIIVKVNSDSVITRDRSYQNGDGFHITIAKPQKGGLETDEFYVLGFSTDTNGFSKFIWYRNIDLSFKRLKYSDFKFRSTNGITYYEILIKTDDICPYNPLLFGNFGFNLCFVKASGDKGKIFCFTAYDPKMQNEQSRRLYKILEFQTPELLENSLTAVSLGKNNFFEGEKLKINYAGIAPAETPQILSIQIQNLDDSSVISEEQTIKLIPGITKNEFTLNNINLPHGNYILKWSSPQSNGGEQYFTVFPEFSAAGSYNILEQNKNSLTQGTYNTIKYHISEIENKLTSLKPYDHSKYTCELIKNISSELSSINSGKDNLKTKTGTFRRAYISSLDGTLQPYSIKIPDDFNPGKKYPLLIHLHGSGKDDRGILNYISLSENQTIELAPNGRGTSNCYSVPESQLDIEESIKDVIENYPVDTSKIILTGFSMGGYGVYRTQYEHPGKFTALAVFAGNPGLASRWLEGEHPDFLEEKYLSVFKNIKIFIFHGTKDLNCPYSLTLKFIDKLKNAGAEVTFLTEETGHKYPSGETLQQYHKWLNEILK